MGVQWMERNRRLRPPFNEWTSLDIKSDSNDDTGTLLRLHMVAVWHTSAPKTDFVCSLEFYKIEEVPCEYLGRRNPHENVTDQRTRHESGCIAIEQ